MNGIKRKVRWDGVAGAPTQLLHALVRDPAVLWGDLQQKIFDLLNLSEGIDDFERELLSGVYRHFQNSRKVTPRQAMSVRHIHERVFGVQEKAKETPPKPDLREVGEAELKTVMGKIPKNSAKKGANAVRCVLERIENTDIEIGAALKEAGFYQENTNASDMSLIKHVRRVVQTKSAQPNLKEEPTLSKDNPRIASLLGEMEELFDRELQTALCEWNSRDSSDPESEFHRGRMEQTKVLRRRIRDVFSAVVIRHIENSSGS